MRHFLNLLRVVDKSFANLSTTIVPLNKDSLDLLYYSTRRHIFVRYHAYRTVEARCNAALSKRRQTRPLGYLEAMGSDSQAIRQGVPPYRWIFADH